MPSDLLIGEIPAEIAQAIERERSRAEGTAALDIDYYSPVYITQTDVVRRWTVARFEWRGGRWRRATKLGWRMDYQRALVELRFHMRRLGMPHISEV